MQSTYANHTFAFLYGSQPEFSDYVLTHWYNQTVPDSIFLNLVGIYVTIIGFTGVIGNLFVIYIFSMVKSLRTPQNMLVINLAISDMVFSAINGFPLKTIAAFNHRWGWGKFVCELYGFSGGLFGFASLTTMVMISVERYLAIVWYVEPSVRMNSRKAFMAIIFIWTWSAIWPSSPIFGIGRYVLEGFHTSCTFDYISRDWPNLVFNMNLYVFGFLLPVMVMIFCYFEIVRFVRRNERELIKLTGNSHVTRCVGQNLGYRKMDIEATKSATILVALFLMAWTPYAIICATSLFGYQNTMNPFMTELPGLFAKTSAIYNPIVYMIKTPKFRRILWQRFKIFHWCLPKQKRWVGLTVVSRITLDPSQNSLQSEQGAQVQHIPLQQI